MIEQLVRQHLMSALSCPVLLEHDENEPETFVLIQKTGGGQTNYIRRATFAVQSYGSSLYEAARLNEAVVGAMSEMPESMDVYSCRLNSDYNYTDTTTKRYRYQAVFELTY